MICGTVVHFTHKMGSLVTFPQHKDVKYPGEKTGYFKNPVVLHRPK